MCLGLPSTKFVYVVEIRQSKKVKRGREELEYLARQGDVDVCVDVVAECVGRVCWSNEMAWSRVPTWFNQRQRTPVPLSF
jgi:hypothetical protein